MTMPPDKKINGPVIRSQYNFYQNGAQVQQRINGTAQQGMTHEQFLAAAKAAGACESTIERLKSEMSSDSDGKVTNQVEASMLNSIMSPNAQMPRASFQEKISSAWGDDKMSRVTSHHNNKDGTFINTVYDKNTRTAVSGSLMYNDENSGKSYQLSDTDGDGKPDVYVEYEPANGKVFNETRRVNLNDE